MGLFSTLDDTDLVSAFVFRYCSGRDLRANQPRKRNETASAAEFHHEELRRTQGYSAAMMANESPMLQLSVFETLDANMEHFDLSLFVGSLMAITDEISSELA